MTEREKQEQFLFLLLQLATRRERQVIKENREPFLFMMRDLRRLVQQMSPDGEFRQYEWRRLRRLAGPMINNFVVGFTERMMPELVALERPVQEFAQDYADIEEPRFIPQTEEEVLRNVFIDNSKLPLAAYVIFNGRLQQDLLTKFNRVVDVGLLRGDSTETIANNVLPLTMRNGRVVGVVRTGTYANNASAQINNTLDGAVWGQINQNLKLGWRDTRPKRWAWNAVLDSRTCPVCSPLDGKIVPEPPTFVPTGFSRTLPPVHPRCRCSILPVFT